MTPSQWSSICIIRDGLDEIKLHILNMHKSRLYMWSYHNVGYVSMSPVIKNDIICLHLI
jgi:hypothetical protein